MKSLIAFFLSLKVIVVLLMLFAASTLPYASQFYNANFRYPANEEYSVFTALKTWDAQHYLYLAENGYSKANESVVFFPLYPFFIRLVSFVTGGNSLIAGLLVSNIFSLGVVYFLYKHAKQFFSDEVAEKAVMLFLVFPTAFYLSLVYTESVFLFFTLGFFYFLFKKNYYLAGLFSLFIPLSRPVGVFIVLPFLLFFLLDSKKRIQKITLPSFSEKIELRITKDIFALLFPLIGLGLYFLLMQMMTGNFFLGFSRADMFIGRYSILNILSPSIFFHELFTPQLTLHFFTTSLIDRLFFVFFLCMLPFIYRFNKTLFIYSISLGLVPLFGSFMGYIRYLLPVFPLFFVIASALSKKRWQVLYTPLLFFLFAFQVLFCILYALNYWVS